METRPGRLVEKHDAISQAYGLSHVVGDEHHREVPGTPQQLQLLVKRVACHGIERPERLVHEKKVRILSEGPGKRDPLLHATRELMGTAPLGPGELYEIEKLTRSVTTLDLVHPP